MQTRKHALPCVLVTFLALTASAGSAGAKTLIHAGRLIDGRADTARTSVTIVIDGDRITSIANGFTPPAAGDTVIDLRAATVMPGLMDMHVHLSDQQQGAAGYAEQFYLNPADFALRATTYAKKTLLAGFTTVRDCGAGDKLNLALRDAIAKGWIDGPRVVAAGSVTTTGGHGDGTNGLATELQEALKPVLPGTADGPDAMRAAVRQRYKDGADFIKIAATGGVLSLARSGQAPLFTDDELAAVVQTARDYGMAVAAHAHGAEGMLRAVRAGVRSIEHGTFMTDEVMAAMKERGTYYVPTISAGKFVAEKAKIDGYFPLVVRPKAAAIGPQIQETFSRAWKAGVKIAFGTDQGVAPHGDNGYEFVYMVEAGMPAMAAIKASTLEAARLLDMEKEIGTVEAGKAADLVAVPGDPLTDITQMTHVSFVMKGGVVFKK
jgi:imidazolonepropionase-like amidohydrolase